MDGIGIIVIIVLGIIVSAISSAAKKKASGSDEEDGAPRRPVMSDIQRAFMMMSGQDDENERKRSEVLRGFKAPPPPQSGTPAYNEGSAGAEGLRKNEGLAGNEGRSDFGSAPRGSILGNTAIENEAGVYKYAAAAENLKEAAESVTEDETSTLTDITAGDMEHRLDESAEMADIAESSKIAATRRVKPALKLFENKNDFVKAVIFSEVLARRQPAGRAAVKR